MFRSRIWRFALVGVVTFVGGAAVGALGASYVMESAYGSPADRQFTALQRDLSLLRLAEQGKVDIGQRALLDRLVWTTHGDTLALALIANNLRWSQHRHGLARLMSDLDGVGLLNDERDAASRPMRELRRCVATQAATSTPEPTACATQLRMAAAGALADGFGARAQRD